MIDIKRLENETLNCSINVIVVDGAYWFRGKDVAKSLGYINTAKAVLTHVEDDDRAKMNELGHTVTGPLALSNNEQNSMYVNESGLYALILKSEKPEAKAFKKWLTSEVLPAIRETGEYKLPEPHKTPKETLQLKNETDLHYKVVEYLKRYFPHARLGAGLGEHQTTTNRRIDAWKKGYQRGAPDLIIYNKHVKYNGFAIEFKTPTGKGRLSEDQCRFLQELEQYGYKTLVSNDYDEIVHEIEHYFRSLRWICVRCKRRRYFCSLPKLQEHEQENHQ